MSKREHLQLIKKARSGAELLDLIDHFGARELRLLDAHEFVETSMMKRLPKERLRAMIDDVGVDRVEDMLEAGPFAAALSKRARSLIVPLYEEIRRRMRVFVLAPGAEIPEGPPPSRPSRSRGGPRHVPPRRVVRSAEVGRGSSSSAPPFRIPPEPRRKNGSGSERAPSGESEAVKLLGGLLPGVRDKSSLRAWARERQVTPWLDVPARSMERETSGDARQWLFSNKGRRATLQRILLDGIETSVGAVDTNPAPVVLRQMAAQTLVRAAKRTAEALEHEAELKRDPARPPETGALLSLWEELVEVRDAMRDRAAPRRVGSRVGVAVKREPGRLVISEPVRDWCSGGNTPEVRISLDPEAKEQRVSCDCARPRSGGCSVRIGAMDHVLELLSDPDEEGFRADVLAAMNVPGWGHALGELDDLLAMVEPEALPDGRADGARLGWRLKGVGSGDLELEPVDVQRIKTGGVRTRALEAGLLRERPELLESAADRRVLEIVEALRPVEGVNPYRGDLRERTLTQVYRALFLLAGHERVFLSGRNGLRLTLRESPVRLDWHQESDGSLEITVFLGDEAQDDLGPLLALARNRRHGNRVVRVDEERALCELIPMSTATMELLGFLHRRGTQVEPEATPELMERLPTIQRVVPVRLDDELRGEEREAQARPLVRLRTVDGALEVEWRCRPDPAGKAYRPGKGPLELHGREDGVRWTMRRDPARELAEVDEARRRILVDSDLEDAGLEGQLDWRLAESEEALRCLEALQEAAGDIDTEWSGAPRRVTSAAQSSDLRVSVRGLEHWFAVGGELDLGGASVDLDALLDAVGNRRDFVRVDEETWLKISDRLRGELEPLAAAVWSSKKGLEISPMHGPVLDALAELGADVDAVADWTLRMDRLRESEGLEDQAPEGLQAELRNYQLEGYRWLCRMAHWAGGACLADDMGLGKTVQALALLLRRKHLGPALVIAPTSVGFNWERETERFAPSLRVHRYRGPAREEVLEGLGPGDLVISNYAILARDELPLSSLSWASVVLDESQYIKNPRTQTAKAAFALEAGFRLALTGTPVENRTGDLWSLMRFLAPGFLGSRAQFRARFALPIERDGDTERRAQLARMVRPFMLRRVKSEVAEELPDRTEVTLHVELSPEERALYEQQRNEGLAALSEGADASAPARRMQALAALTRLRQLACHPRLLDPDSDLPSSKLQTLRELVEELSSEGHRCLIFSQFTRHLALVREALTADGLDLRYLDGSTPVAQRRAEVDKFQAGDGDAFLISLKAGGTGLNLTAATYVIHLDPWWNPAAEDQASDRSHRIGQKRAVTVYRLISSATVEEAVLRLQESKRALIAGLLEGTGESGSLSAEELVELMQV